jgi:hypothetical protein
MTGIEYQEKCDQAYDGMKLSRHYYPDEYLFLGTHDFFKKWDNALRELLKEEKRRHNPAIRLTPSDVRNFKKNTRRKF